MSFVANTPCPICAKPCDWRRMKPIVGSLGDGWRMSCGCVLNGWTIGVDHDDAAMVLTSPNFQRVTATLVPPPPESHTEPENTASPSPCTE